MLDVRVLLLICLGWAGALLAPAHAQGNARATFETTAKHAILLDVQTRSVLFEHQARLPIPPASLVKIMTAAVVFREISEGRLTLENDMVVSADAWRRGGAVSGSPNMLLTPNKVVKVSELLTGLAVGSANDAAIALAENIAGTEAKFTDLMNAYARRLGLGAMVFRNATGFLAEGQQATLHDLVQLTAHLVATYPEQYALFGQKDMPFGRNRQANRNPLITMEIGADGVMTGSVPDFGHLIIGSAVQEGRRLIVGIAGTTTVQERALEARKLLEWGFRRFEIRDLFPAGAEIGQVSVYGGAARSVAVETGGGIRLPVLRGASDALGLQLAYDGPVRAPIAAGQEIARLDIMQEGRIIQSSPLRAVHAVPVGGVIARARDATVELSRQGLARSVQWLLETIGLKTKTPPRDSLAGAERAG